MSDDSVPMVQCAPAMAWVKDADQLLLVDGDGQDSWTLYGVEAAIWDLLTLGYRLDAIVRFVAALLAVPREEARATVLATLHGWVKAGIVQAAGGNGHG